ncbi:MAG: hypothetical protein NVS4B3_01690 [Gemmatimonadaceae bacterium]
MIALFLSAFILGLLLGVGSMLFGVERRRSEIAALSPLDFFDTQSVSARLNLPTAAAFLAVFGVVGYLVRQHSTLSSGAVAGIAATAGLAGAAGAIALVAAWAVPSARKEVIDPRFVLMGTLAAVTHPIGPHAAGEITYEFEGRQFTAPARALEEASVAAGTEVVIERLEDGVAYVEAWSIVEKRI